MNQPFYNFTILNQALRFDFLSTGKNIISKSVIYTQTDVPGFYSLALLDVYPDGTSDDTSVTDNGDMEKILVTVFQTFAVFFKTILMLLLPSRAAHLPAPAFTALPSLMS
jgi:hypothetical protein